MNLLSPFLIQTTIFIIFPLNFNSSILTTAQANARGDVTRGNNTDYEALLSFKSKITHDTHGALSSWNSSIQFCNWIGVTCGRRHRRVTEINLFSEGISGTLSPFIGNLSFLRVIRLQNNTFRGEIPPEITRLFRLRELYLSNNSLVGQIPANLSSCTQLVSLYLSRNKLVGKIPTELGSLVYLKSISIHHNNLHGDLPYSIGNLTALEVLYAGANVLRGTIPNSFGQLRKLTFFALQENDLSGIIPSSLYNLSFIDTFSLNDNQLHGTLPSKLGLFYPHLVYFGVWSNQFSGPIPPSLSNASQLQLVSLGDNDFSGKIPDFFQNLQDLSYLNLEGNNLGTGGHNDLDFLASLVNCTKLIQLGLATNRIGGTLPMVVANLSAELREFTIGYNPLTGTIPSGIGNLVNLANLELSNNQLTGTLPNSIGQLQNLLSLYIFSTRLSGKIPSSIGNLSWLTNLNLCDNRLQGSIPSSLGSCKNLLELNLSENNLNGSIPEDVFNIPSLSIALILHHNQFTGSLPSSAGNLKSIGDLDISWNKLSGEIPSSLGSCFSLELLYLDHNLFHGSIPSSFSSLKGIQYLDLSHNNLTGLIPTYLATIPFLYLNLSYNNFEGEVPKQGIFRNQSVVSVAENDRLCGGTPELNLPQCSFNKRKFSTLRLSIIIIGCLLFGLTMLSCFLFLWLKTRRKQKISTTLLKEPFAQISYEQISRSTDGFSQTNLIGVGSFGRVYKGNVDEEDGTSVAIKVLNLERRGASRSFTAECEALKHIRHRNLVKIITSCSSIDFKGNDFKALVYEYMPNGSLEKWLHPDHHEADQKLSIRSRLNIAIDVACAIDYLHNQCHHRIIHCDLKPSNVLLDNEMTAHVGDFGLARILREINNANQSSTIGVKGTVGYAE